MEISAKTLRGTGSDAGFSEMPSNINIGAAASSGGGLRLGRSIVLGQLWQQQCNEKLQKDVNSKDEELKAVEDQRRSLAGAGGGGGTGKVKGPRKSKTCEDRHSVYPSSHTSCIPRGSLV